MGKGTDGVVGKNRRGRGELYISEEKMRNMEKMLYEMGGSKIIILQDAILLLELPGVNLYVVKSDGNNILSLGAGTYQILHKLRASQTWICPHRGSKSIPMVLTINIGKMRMYSSNESVSERLRLFYM